MVAALPQLHYNMQQMQDMQQFHMAHQDILLLPPWLGTLTHVILWQTRLCQASQLGPGSTSFYM